MFKYILDKNDEGAYMLKRNGYSLRCHINSAQVFCSSYCPHFKITGSDTYAVSLSCGFQRIYFNIDNSEILKEIDV